MTGRALRQRSRACRHAACLPDVYNQDRGCHRDSDFDFDFVDVGTIYRSVFLDSAAGQNWALHLGVTDFLVKPLEEGQLLDALESAKSKVKLMLRYDEIASLPAKAELKPPSFEALDDKLKTSRHVAKMIEYVQENDHRKISIHHLVNLLGLSASYLSQKFKLETSYTFNDFLNRYRIHKAMEMLRTGEGKVYTIAQDCGFSDYKYFISIFKKYANCTPGQYQEFCEREK